MPASAPAKKVVFTELLIRHFSGTRNLILMLLASTKHIQINASTSLEISGAFWKEIGSRDPRLFNILQCNRMLATGAKEKV